MPFDPAKPTSGDDLDAAISGTGNTSNGVAMLGILVSTPPTQNEVQWIASKVDERSDVLRREGERGRDFTRGRSDRN